MNFDEDLKVFFIIFIIAIIIAIIAWWRKLKADKVQLIKDEYDFELSKDDKLYNDLSLDDIIKRDNERLEQRRKAEHKVTKND